jgi:hypothetical protein
LADVTPWKGEMPRESSIITELLQKILAYCDTYIHTYIHTSPRTTRFCKLCAYLQQTGLAGTSTFYYCFCMLQREKNEKARPDNAFLARGLMEGRPRRWNPSTNPGEPIASSLFFVCSPKPTYSFPVPGYRTRSSLGLSTESVGLSASAFVRWIPPCQGLV